MPNLDSLTAATHDGGLTATEVRALLNVAIDLAEDLGTACAVVVLDPGGSLRGAERPGTVPGDQLDRAVRSARQALSSGEREVQAAHVGAVVLNLDGSSRGALGISGGPDGFAIVACRAAAHALGL